MANKRKHVISTKLTDDEFDQFMGIVESEHFVGKSALMYMIVAEYLKNRSLEEKGFIMKPDK